jgi:hypothetical protein
MGLQGRPSFYPNMSMASNLTNLRFRENMDGLPMNNNKNEPMSPGCAPGLPTGDADGPPPSFYPWMSIVGEYANLIYLSHPPCVKCFKIFRDVLQTEYYRSRCFYNYIRSRK